jgi:hypothetical protein
MKRIFCVLLMAFIFCSAAALAFAKEEKVTPKTFSVYSDKDAADNHYVPSGWIGDYGDLKLNYQAAKKPHSGKTSIEIVYTAKKSQGKRWAGLYWQSSVNNWGSKKGGFDLTGMVKLSFWARGAKGGEVVQKFMVGGIKGIYPDSANVEMGPIELTNTWKEYTIDLTGKDLSYINGGFGLTFTADSNPDGATFYLDDIKFTAEPAVMPEAQGSKK